jgi:threonine dehydrogenase-like Zn-dependent dehydrogenase
MQALVLTEQGPRLAYDYPLPVPLPGEAVVRPRLVGICATDLALIRGYKGGFRGILGHEFVGEVVDAPTASEWVGRRVVGEINIGCGECVLCQRGLHKHCRQRSCLGIVHKDGALAQRFTLPVANLHEVPGHLSDDEAVFTEPLAAAVEVLEQVRIVPSTRVFLLGAGKLGMLLGQVLALTGCDLTVIGRHAAPLRLLKQWHGCQTLLSDDDALGALAAAPADVVVEATGTPQGFELARRIVRPAGTVVLKSTFPGDMTPVDLSGIVVDEVSVVGSRCGPFAPALRLLEQDKVQVKPLISGCYALDDIMHALAHAEQRGVLKILVRV